MPDPRFFSGKDVDIVKFHIAASEIGHRTAAGCFRQGFLTDFSSMLQNFCPKKYTVADVSMGSRLFTCWASSGIF